MAEQLAFSLAPPRSVSERHFVAAPSNATARHWLNQTGWPDRRLLLAGEDRCGKSHLLHIWAQKRRTELLDAATLEMDLIDRFGHAMPPSLAIDNIERITSERSLLHLLNRARESRTTLLLASRISPMRQTFVLPDLASRLRAVTVVTIAAPEDSLRFTLLLRLIAERQIVVAKPMIDWLLRHLPRTGAAIVEAVDRLDEAGLASGRPLTPAMARNALKGLLEEDDSVAF
ncbi:chromosome replication initiator DnaA [Swaminathania salitolerans LMG 21291]|nr:chromosome replication initiator DnaA [Swaminathania salitolerans LMG 21291]